MKEILAPGENRPEDLKKWLDKRGIKLILFDLDDTLIDTNNHFNRRYGDFFALVGKRLSFSADELTQFTEIFHRLDIEVFYTHFVNPVRYLELGKKLAAAYQPGREKEVSAAFEEGLPILLEIYKTVPDFHPGAEETLSVLKTTGTEMGLVTHGNLTWSNLKIRELDLKRFFNHFWIADEDGVKNSGDWLAAVNSFPGIKPAETLVIGDNLRGDIMAADEAGIRYKALIPSNWVVYREGGGAMPANTVFVPKIDQLIDSLLKSNLSC